MKKTIYIMLCSLILAGALAGCSARPEPPDATSAPAQTPSADLTAKRQAAFEKADALAAGYYYDDALAALEAFKSEAGGDGQTEDKLAEIKAAKAGLVNYTGDIPHIFFHSLIVYPEMVFKDKTTPMGGYNAGFSEKAEIEKILPELYKRGYVLYDLDKCWTKVDGKMTRQDIMLPEGKKPLILSVDDVAYAYGDGFAQKLIVKADGSLVNLVKNPQGQTEEMADGDVQGVVDAFVKEHPDFSYQGHKGTFALTGYQGAFGYSYDTEEGQADIKNVVAALKADGWNFASHSYTHNRDRYYGPGSKPENIRYDINKWNAVVRPCLGDTRLFIAPFGYRVKEPGLQHVLDGGFDIYCTVNNKIINELYDDYALMSRIEISGYSMTYYKTLLRDNFFDPDTVLDTASRPPVTA